MSANERRAGATRRTWLKRGAVLGGLSVLGMPKRLEGAPTGCGVTAGTGQNTEKNGQWSLDRVNAWYAATPWPVGCNFIPSTAVNQIETWQAESFDPETIDRELGLAAGLGFNTARVFFHDLVWEADPDGFKKRFDKFLDLGQKHRIRAIPTFFTNGCYHRDRTPKLGKQPDPVPGVHNSGWVQTPGAPSVNDPATWGRLEKYVKDVIGAFAKDERVLLWYLYNEPWNATKGAKSMPLMREVFNWARAINPSQPITACLECGAPLTPMNVFLVGVCDVLTFHSYSGAASVESELKRYKAFKRPILCGEYMARPGSTFQAILPILKRERVMAMNFGLVAGKGNFYYRWGSKEGSPEPKVWFHDIFRKDGTPYDAEEVKLIRQLTGVL